MGNDLYYVFDPLCGWCYGASGTISALAKTPGIRLRPSPSGLFAGNGARPMDGAFAAHAWSNDQRIERLTGQRFSERYRQHVLGDRQRPFDSGPATLALTAVAMSAPQREVDALEAIQHARYVDGQDVTRVETLAAVLRGLGLDAAAVRLARPDAGLLEANRARIDDAQALLAEFGARGVPTFVVDAHGHRRILHANAAYSNPQAFVNRIATA